MVYNYQNAKNIYYILYPVKLNIVHSVLNLLMSTYFLLLEHFIFIINDMKLINIIIITY